MEKGWTTTTEIKSYERSWAISNLPSKYADVDECARKQCGDDSLCQNYHGGYDCECNAIGYYKVNNKGECKRKVFLKNTFKIGGGFPKDIVQKMLFALFWIF